MDQTDLEITLWLEGTSDAAIAAASLRDPS
jgi:hypothetical protein